MPRRQALPDDLEELCSLCLAGKLFAVQKFIEAGRRHLRFPDFRVASVALLFSFGNPMKTASDAVDARDASAFEADGVVCIRGLIGGDHLHQLRELSALILENRSPLTTSSGRVLPDSFCWIRNSLFLSILRTSNIFRVAAKLMGADEVRLFYDQILDKPPSSGVPTPWHQDLPYWPLAGDQICTIWVALDTITSENGAMHYFAGSHRSGDMFRPTSFQKDQDWAATSFPPLPPIGELEESFDLRSWDLSAGDAIVHHALTIHGAGGNVSLSQRRRAYITRWFGPTTRYDPRPETMEFPVSLCLRTGDPLHLRLFPRFRTT
jgi:ectoine hydroxylase-related dioxygenase (phytanoyl-CoA dioxygenase family)